MERTWLTDEEFEIFINLILEDNPEFFSDDFCRFFHDTRRPPLYIEISSSYVEMRAYEDVTSFGGTIFIDGYEFPIGNVNGLERLDGLLKNSGQLIEAMFTKSHIERYSELMQSIQSAIIL